MSINNDDNLFLSTQALHCFNHHNTCFGKIIVDPAMLNNDSILFIDGNHSLEYGSGIIPHAIILSQNVLYLKERLETYACPLIVVKAECVFTPGDIVSISPKGRIQREFRVSSKNNALLVTEACNNLCIMCPQPPKPEDRSAWAQMASKIERILSLIDEDDIPQSLCITGGEPTMLGDSLINIVSGIAEKMPETLIHLLSNGRYLCHESYTARLAAAAKGNMLIGIPLFAHVSDIHDYVVQSRGAFEQTMAGLLNCYKYGIPIELRVVLNKATVPHLPALSQFIARNLFFVKHVALMGMENMGFAKLNRDDVFIDPWEYRDTLSEAVRILRLYEIDTRVFNLPLCVVNTDTHDYCAKSISDFKQMYYEICQDCAKQDACCGFFSSSTPKHYLTQHVTPYPG